MEFRPCIDIHNGKVKQIVGGSLRDENDSANENFVAEKDSVYYAQLYRNYGLMGGHVILLNSADSQYYEATRQAAINALNAYPGGLQVGGGINHENAEFYLEAGASHVIVTSYVFANGQINYENLERVSKVAGKERLVLDMSCRYKDKDFYVVTDRWQRFTNQKVTPKLFEELGDYCDEFLVHGVDVEGKSAGIDERLAEILVAAGNNNITYAGGIGSIAELERLKCMGNGKINATIGSALDIFGGTLSIEEVMKTVSL